ncbi:MAG: MBL fold metallo-hydrolase [Candidatus Hecatellaceae archaeon]
MGEVEEVSPGIWLIDLQPPLKGLERIFGSYLIKGEKIALVESGFSNAVDNLVSQIQNMGVSLEEVSYVFGTHIHLDHAGGFGHLAEKLPKARFFIHPRGLPHLVNPERLWKASMEALGDLAFEYGKPKPVSEQRLSPLQDGETVSLGGGLKIKVIETLGHASHHMSFLEERNRVIFTGDSCGIRFEKYGIVRPVTPAVVSLPEMLSSLEKMEAFNPKALAFTHFGLYPNPDGAFTQFRQALRLWLSLSLKALKAGKGLEEAYAEVKLLDKPLEPVVKRRTEVFIRQSIEGIIDFIKRKGLEQAEAVLRRLEKPSPQSSEA